MAFQNAYLCVCCDHVDTVAALGYLVNIPFRIAALGSEFSTERFPCRRVSSAVLALGAVSRVCFRSFGVIDRDVSCSPPSQRWRIYYLPLPGFPALTALSHTFLLWIFSRTPDAKGTQHKSPRRPMLLMLGFVELVFIIQVKQW